MKRIVIGCAVVGFVAAMSGRPVAAQDLKQQLAAAQIDAFTSRIRDNNRPAQPLNGRRVITDAIGEAK